MILKKLQLFTLFTSATCVYGYYYPAIDQSLFENVLDAELCDEQLQEIISNPLLSFTFLDSGLRFPRGILKLNLVDHGNYHQCLEINQQLTNSIVEGKHCSISILASQELIDFVLNNTDIPFDSIGLETLGNEEMYQKLSQDSKQFEKIKNNAQIFTGRASTDSDPNMARAEPDSAFRLSLTMAMCLPKVCSPAQVISFLSNSTIVNVPALEFTEDYCRLPNDKPWVPIDYVAVVVFSIFGVLNILSTSYDLYTNFGAKKVWKPVNKLYTSFSVYSNTRRLVTYNSNPKTIECLDGIRVIAMAWVILGHRFISVLTRTVVNLSDALEWAFSSESLWSSASPITVDTFFCISGLLIVYTTAGKLTNVKLIQRLHMFYLHRITRMFPMLAVAILLEGSIINRVVDGPNWTVISRAVESCRANWWATLLYVQNYVNFSEETTMCLGQTWYLAVDMQLHILSPIVLFWVLTNRKAAWISMVGVLLISIIATTIYVFLNNFPAGLLSVRSISKKYFKRYYTNTLTRASPFLVGMIYGYILHEMNGRKIRNQIQGLFLWALSAGIAAFVFYTHYPLSKPDWDNSTLDNLANSFLRPVWAVAIGWMILACHSGFGGPINWFLSLRFWKIPSRLSYAMFLFHFGLIYATNATDTAPIFFSPAETYLTHLGDLMLTTIVAFLATITIDAPCSTLIKMAMGGGNQKPALNQNGNTDHKQIIKTSL